MHSGDIVELDVTGIAHGGVFVARHEGMVVFVPDAVPGERVVARVSEAKRSFARAELLEVRDASPHRRPHVWPEAEISLPPEERAGGADLGHIALPHQRELKGRVLAEAFERFAGERVDAEVEPAGGDETADGARWRTRVSLHVDDEGRVGPYAARSHRVIPVSSHPLATAAVEAAALALHRERPGRVDLVQPSDGRVRTLRRPRPDAHDRRRGRRDQRGARPEPEVVAERVGDRLFRVDAGGFWQVHRLAAATLHAVVSERIAALAQEGVVAADGRHLDLYGGVGLFADAIAGALGEHGAPVRVTSIESAPRATAHATENLAGHPAAEAVTGRVERRLAEIGRTVDADESAAFARGVVLLDPPRAGAGAEVVEGIAALDPAAVVYVACDPVALARDVAGFRDRGYRMEHLRAFDLFPHSHHLESVAVLRRR